ncbi:MAG: prolyl oligopeptidase family serine peptidase [Burkholderiaceae bacterium]|nr:prolyl oligopeptidase family serine peptidase [Burkholderiaceae bacterium]
MRIAKTVFLTALAALALAACGGGSTGGSTNGSAQPGTLIYSPPLRSASVNATDFGASLGATAAGQQLLAVAGQPKCGIDFYYYQYQTVGGKNEQATASGVIMVPTGSTAGCSGALPILLYTHGTMTTRSYNLGNPSDTTNEAWTTADGGSEGPIISAMFAAQGYIVVASNYAGYDSSTLPYHPYLIGDQQAKDVINSLTAARTALKGGLSGVSDNGKLFITGHSEGGYVTMATYRAMLAAKMPVTAVAPTSGAFDLEAFGDASVLGEVTLASPINFTFVIGAYQTVYGDIYTSPTDVFSATYATGIGSLLPGAYTGSQLIGTGKVPQTALFSSTPTGLAPLDTLTAGITAASPLAALGFGDPYLINNSVRIAYAADAFANPDHGLHAVPPFGGFAPWSSFADFGVAAAAPSYPLRAHLHQNDLRATTWAPATPVLMCAGHDDPEVPYAPDTGLFSQFWAPYLSTVPFGGTPNNLVTVLDVDPDATAGGIQSTIATLAATAFATGLATHASPAKIAAEVQAAVIGNFAAHFNFTGPTPVPVDPQGLLVAALAGVAAQVVVTEYAAGVTDPVTMGQDVLLGTSEFYHFPSTQVACDAAVRGFFAPLSGVAP